MTIQSESLPLAALNTVMDEEHRETVVRRSVEYLKANKGKSRALNAALRSVVQIPGYKNATRAPLPQLVPATIDGFARSNEVVASVLALWIEASQGLMGQMIEALQTEDVETVDPNDVGRTLVGLHRQQDMEDHTEAFLLQAHTEYSRGDVVLAYCLLRGTIPLSKEMEERMEIASQGQAEMSPLWDRCLEQLRLLPPEAVEWDHLQALVAAVSELAKMKAQERQGLEALQSVLDALRGECADQIRFFELNECDTWMPEDCALGGVPEALEQVNSLREVLAQYREVEANRPTVFSERQSRNRRLGTVGNRAIKTYQQLTSAFASGTAERRQVPVAVEGVQSAEDEREEGQFWNDWLEQLEVLPPTAPEWENTDAFLRAVKKLAKEDSSQRRDLGALQAALDHLRTDCAHAVKYFQFGDCAAWKADRCPADEVMATSERVATLERTLVEYIDLEQSQPASFVERQAQNRKFEGLAAEAHGQYQVLCDVFVAETGEEDSEPRASIEESVREGVGAAKERVQETKTVEHPEVLQPKEEDIERIEPKDAEDEAKVEAGLAGEEVPRATDFLWQLLSVNDGPGAYWYARSLESRGEIPAVPSWLLAALQGSHWLEDSISVVLEDLKHIAYNHELEPDPVHHLLGTAAALGPVLVAPESNMIGWLSSAHKGDFIRPFPGLASFVGAVCTFAGRGLPVYPETLEGALTQEQRNAELLQIREEASRWLEQAPNRRTPFTRATKVWRYLVTNQTDSLLDLLQPVVDDRRELLEKVCEGIHRWSERQFIIDRINVIDSELTGRRLSPIEATARSQISRRTSEACQIADRWCRAVRREEQLQGGGNWLVNEVQEFVGQLKDLFPEAEASLDSMGSDSAQTSMVAASSQIRVTVNQLRRALRMDGGATVAEKRPYPELKGNLEQCLAYRLLWVPECSLENEGQPVGAEIPDLATVLKTSVNEGRTLRQAFEIWLDREDCRFVEEMLAVVTDASSEAEMERQFHERSSASRNKLDRLLAETEDAIELSLVNGVIYDEERSKLSSQVISVRGSVSAGAGSADAINYGALHSTLVDVQGALETAGSERVQQQEELWTDIKERLLGADQEEVIVKAVDGAIAAQAIRVVDEYLAHIDNALRRGARIDPTIFREREEKRDVLGDFVTDLPRLAEFLEQRDINLGRLVKEVHKKSTRFPVLNLGSLATPRRKEVAGAIDAWRELKTRRQGLPSAVQARHIAVLLQYLGFRLSEPGIAALGLDRQIESGASYWQSDMSAAGLSPVPQFGSQSQGKFHLVCIWERPGHEAIGAQLRSLEVQNYPTLVFYFGRLKVNHRLELLRFTRDQSLTIAVLDEILLLFLARMIQARLGPFLECALPFTVSNPYVPFAAGVVPPEMFFGRSGMVRSLQEPTGPCIIYGGRQLGKSALLREVFREFHNPDRERYALLVDIKRLGDPIAGQDTEVLWRHLRDGLANVGLLDRNSSERPERLQQAVQKVLSEDPHRRILVLLDEADKFLDVDAKRNFQVVSQLKEIMDGTSRRFKVVFAGLHNVQRFQGISNQPLAHMGTPLVVGPLEPGAALDLVKDRMTPLGFRFAAIAQILRILSYTNYHPGLIQYFCSTLVKHLYAQRPGRLPPYEVDDAVVEDVYREPDVRDEIRKRFEWTLALDSRYKAIALTIIVDQLETRDSFTRTYNVQELYNLVRAWWPAGFNQIMTDQFRGYLEEMCGLGVLAYTDDGYRLRSPNLVRLMGTEKEIWQALQEVTSQELEIGFDADSHHALLDPAGNRYSPLTYAQERLLNPHHFGVGLVFGSDALGLDSLKEATRRFIPRELEGHQSLWTEMSVIANSGATFSDWLGKYIRDRKDHERLIVYRDLRGTPDQLAEQVEAALKICNRFRKRRDQWLRVILAFDPASMWEWLQLPQSTRAQLENQVDATVALHRWDLVGIRQRLRQHQPEMLASDEMCMEVHLATGGWHFLLDEFIARCAGESDPRPEAGKFGRDLVEGNSGLHKRFCERLGVSASATATEAFRFIRGHMESTFPVDLFHEWLCDETDISDHHCTAAVEYLEKVGVLERDGEDFTIEPIVRRVLAVNDYPTA